MTDPLILQRLTSARLVDLLTEVLTTEARMAALGQLGADIRAELNHRGDETYQRDGMAPTWRADDKLGTISYSVGRDAVVVVDRDEWLNWAAQQHPDEVTASIEFPAAALPFVVELLSWAVSGKSGEQVPPSLSGWRPQPQLTAREAWQKGFLEKHTTVIEPDQICNADGQLIPGLAQRRVGRVGVSVRLNPELKARAIAELGDPATFALLTAPIGEVAGAHPEPDLEADGEPDYDGGLPPVPLHPVQAAAHANTVQRGFSTPAIEAFRILRDAMRIIHSGAVLDERWQLGVTDTLAWLDEQADAEVDGEEARFAAEYPGDWRAELLAHAGDGSIPAELRAELHSGLSMRASVVQMREWCRRLQLPTAGNKRDLFERLAARTGMSTGKLTGAER